MAATDPVPPAAAIARRLAEAAAAVAGDSWNEIRAEILPHLQALAATAHATTQAVGAGQISRADAGFVLECQQLYLANILRHVRLLGWMQGRRLLDGVFATLASLLAEAARD